MSNEELIERAKARALKGVQKSDGFDYSVPAKDIVETNDLIRELVQALVDTETTARVNYGLYKSASDDLDGAVSLAEHEKLVDDAETELRKDLTEANNERLRFEDGYHRVQGERDSFEAEVKRLRSVFEFLVEDVVLFGIGGLKVAQAPLDQERVVQSWLRSRAKAYNIQEES